MSTTIGPVTYHYRCHECGREYEITPDRMRCDTCVKKQEKERPLRGLLEVVLALEPEALPPDWEPIDLLPVEREWFPSIPVGNTPLWEPARLREEYGFPLLYLKDDGLNPTGSLKDRASWLVSAFARKHGIRRIVVASTGNAGSSMAGVGAAAGLEVRLYLPASAPPAKIAQSLQYGADLQKVEGTYDEAFALSLEYLEHHEGLSRNTGFNPLTIEGKKTVSLEIFRQLGGVVPDYVFVSTGDGVIISGVYRGFEDLVTLGFARKVPQIICVQAEGSAAIARAMELGAFGPPVRSTTLADSISVDVPAGGAFALGRLKRHGGIALTVSDDEILRAQRTLAAGSGCFAEPASATAFAGFLRHRQEIPPESRVVVLLTGNGLKDIAAAMRVSGEQ
ncbi:MAG: pyridoxal-phosphate dependent enzyme [Spirochaetaceae bacterium]|nr:MAG: pyridoxal-phosphate dependent enzyme [Spirochaetaceae bacterium]